MTLSAPRQATPAPKLPNTPIPVTGRTGPQPGY